MEHTIFSKSFYFTEFCYQEYHYTDARKGGLTPELRPMITIMFLGILVLLIVINLRKIRNTNNPVK